MGSPTLALIPAKRHSEGRPGKNFDTITEDGRSCVQLAMSIAKETCDRWVASTDMPETQAFRASGPVYYCIERPAELCTPEASMLDVVKHALSVVPGPDDEIIVLLQPTSPLRTVETVKRAIQMLQENTTATSVVSISPSYPNEWQLEVASSGCLLQMNSGDGYGYLSGLPTRRQDCAPVFKRDGVVYVFRRSVFMYSPMSEPYGWFALPIHTPPAESLSIDTPEDWDEAVRRLQARAAAIGSQTAR